MNNTTKVCVVVCAIAISIAVYVYIKKSKSPLVTEPYSYSFGFPTHGAVDNRIHGLLYNGFLWGNPYNVNNPYTYSPFAPYGPNPYNPYFYDSIAPYLSNRCYSSFKNEDCVPGYNKVKTGHKKSPEWKCCRYGW